MSSPRLLCAFALVVLLTVVAAARGDRGSIPFDPSVNIYEPVQRALIAWNGREEILLLTTDLRASAPTKVLEVLPLPAEPKVTKGDVETLRRANRLIQKKLREQRGAGGFGGAARDAAAPAGEVTFHEKIGAHDIRVAKVNDAEGFVSWVDEYLRKAGAENPQIPAPLKSVIEEYLRDGFVWFAFDVVELGTEERTNDAIQYRFATDRLYYPLRITRVERGETDIYLHVLTREMLTEFPGLPMERIELPHTPVVITDAEVKELSPEAHALLGGSQNCCLRTWRIRGRLDGFEKDLLAARRK